MTIIRNSTITGNVANDSRGGAIYVDSDGSLTIENSTISGNTGENGGGITSFGSSLTLRNSTVSGNTATTYDGGGIYVRGAVMTLIENSTISGNHALAATKDGGGLSFRLFTSTAVIRNSTITGNSTVDQGGGIFFQQGGGGGTLTLENSIVEGNADANGLDLFRESGTVNASHSLIQNPEAAAINGTNTANIFGVAAMLGDLEDNGGLTFTHAIDEDSPAFNTGNNALVGGLTTDQRGQGFARIENSRADMGAFEVEAAAPPSPNQPNNLVAKTWRVLFGEEIDAKNRRRYQRFLQKEQDRDARQRVVRKMLASRDYAIHAVESAYERLLGRNPGPVETAKWVGVLQAERSRAMLPQINLEMLRGLLNSPVYFAKQGGTLNGFVQGILNDLYDGVVPPGFSAQGKTKLQIIDDLLSRPRLAVLELFSAYRARFGMPPAQSLVAEWTQRLQVVGSARFILVETLAA